MPVAVRLSKNFYDRFGDDAAGELVNVLNTVDLAYRSELREVNAHNFALFDAKLEQRFAESQARMDALFAARDMKIEQRFAEIDRRFSRMETQLADRETRLIRWMFGFWATNTLALAGLAFAVLRTR